MAYCTTADVQTLLSPVGFVIGQTDPGTGALDEPNSTTVDAIIIPDTDALIDGMLRGAYPVPITNSTDLKQMRMLSMQISAAMCAQYLFGDRANPEASTVLLGHHDRALRRLGLIQGGIIKLDTGRASFVDDGVHSLFDSEVVDSYEAQVEADKEF